MKRVSKSGQFAAAPGEKIFRLDQGQALRQQQGVILRLALPGGGRGLHPGAALDIVAVEGDLIGGARPMGDQRFMGEADHFALDHQQPGVRQGGDQGFCRCGPAQFGAGHGAGGGLAMAALAHRHQLAQQGGEGGLKIGGEAGKDRLRLPGQRAFKTAQPLVGRETQQALGASFLPQLVEQEGQQRQGARRGGCGGPNRLVQGFAGFGAGLEAQPRFKRGQADDLADLAIAGRQQQEARFPAAQRGQARAFGQGIEEIRPHGGHHEDKAGGRQVLKRCDEGFAGVRDRCGPG